MTYTQETGAHVTPERIRLGDRPVRLDGFVLRYERPLEQLDRQWAERVTARVYHGTHLSDYSCNPPGPPRQT